MSRKPDTAPADLRPTRRTLPIALLRARESVMAPIRAMLSASGISEQKWRILRVLQEAGPLELSHLAREACLLLPSLTRLVRDMEIGGLIRRLPPGADRRKVVVCLAPAGADLLLRHADESAAIHARLAEAFGEDRLEALLDLLHDLQDIHPPDPAPPGNAPLCA